MKTNPLKFLLVLSLALNVSFLAAAGYAYFKSSGYWSCPLGFKMEKGEFLFGKLSLRPGQFEAMRARAIRFRTEIDKKRSAVFKKREELFNLLRAENPDRRSIEAKISEIDGLQADIQRLVVAHILDLRAIMDKDQRQKFMDLIEKAMASGKRQEYPVLAN